ncbi:MAG: phage late control D family protein, partial [Deltaproteobacteria bacterium]
MPAFELLVDGQKADPELAGSVIGIRCSDDMDRAARFQLHISDVGRKWTKSDKFKPGTAIEIKLGYVGQLRSVCKAEVQTLEVVLTPDGPTRLLVAGFDKGQGFTKGTQTKTYKDVKDSDLARQIAQRNGLSAEVDDSKVVHDYVIQSNLSDYDFLVQRAAVAGFRFNVDGKKLGFKKPQIGQGSAAKLVWRENIGRFAMEVNTYDQVSKISSSGWDPDKMKNMTSPAKKGDEYGTQGGQVTGAQLVKKMFGEVESVLTVASGQQNLLEAVAKAEFNKRGGTFVAAEGRITGDPAVKAGTVIEVDKAGQRVNGQYYVTGSEHIFFADTGYATEFRAKRYAIKKQSSPVKDLAKFAKAVQEAAKKAQEIAQKIKEAAAFALKAAREAAKRAQQACDSAKALYNQVKQALEQVKSGAGDVAKTMLQQAEQQIAGIKGYLSEAGSKVSEAAGEAAAAADDAAKKALQTAHEAAGSVVDLAKNAYQHAQDAFDAVKAAALDAVHTSGDPDAPLSGPVQGIKKSLLAAAETALAIGKAGMTLANVAIAKGKSAIEMCAAKADAMAKPLIEAIGGELSKVIDSVKQSGKASNQSILGAISSGAQHALDQAKKAVSQAQEAIAKAKEAVQN